MPDQAEQMSRRFEDFDLRLRNVEHDVASIKANYATRSDVAELRADMQRMHTDTTRWIIATVISLFLGFSGLFFVMSQAANKPAPSAAPVPIIIQVPSPASTPSASQSDREQITPHR